MRPTPPIAAAPEWLCRRAFLRSSGLGLGAAALGTLLNRGRAVAVQDHPHVQAPHFAPRAKHVIYLHMIGAPSQLDLFDAKPDLVKQDGRPCPERLLAGKQFAFIGGEMTLSGSRVRFGRHGQSGQEMSELLPHLAGVADELAIIRSLRTEEINHAPAQMFLHSGFGRGGRPSLGAWVTYGLGSECDDLPAFVVLLSGPPGGAGT